MKETSISVVIPLYNSERTIAATLASVFHQTSIPNEVIVVNDGSTDQGAQVVYGLIENDTYGPQAANSSNFLRSLIRIIHQENQGAGAARNAGLGLAKSEWCAFLDSDDLWFPNHIQELRRMTSLFPDAHLLGTSYVLGPLGVNVSECTPQEANEVAVEVINYFSVAARKIDAIWSSAAAVRTRSAIEIGGFGNWEAGEDLEMWARLALHYPVARSTRVTSVYVQNPNSIMANLAQRSTPARLACSLEEISPSSGTVYQALNKGGHRVQSTSLKAYLNGRLSSSVKASLVDGEVSAAKHLARLAYQPSTWTMRLTRWTPAFLLRLIVFLWRTIRPFRQLLHRS